MLYKTIDSTFLNGHNLALSLDNYPNPFNPNTTISFQLPYNDLVILTVYNSLGQLVEKLLNEKKEKGFYTIQFSGEKYPSGIYFITLKTTTSFKVRKMLLTK